MRPIYLDHNATTPVDPLVLDAMLPFLREDFGNPSSAYPLGRRAHDAIEKARAEVAALIGARAQEITFTSGGTEASNIAIRSSAKRDPKRRAVVTSLIEHPATEACCALLAGEGHTIARVAPDRDGIVAAGDFARAIDGGTGLVTLIHAQNEIGTLQPVRAVADLAHAHGALMHTDVAQSLGKIPVDVGELGVDLLSIAGHKLYAPKGIGALYVRDGISLASVLRGAGQEHGRRPGTENVAGIVALGAAARLAADYLRGPSETLALTTALLARLRRDIPDIVCVGEKAPRLPNTLNVLFPAVSGRKLLEACPGVMASTGSACHADSEEPSAIQIALGIAPARALGAVRLTLGRATNAQAIDDAAARLIAAWRSLANTSSAAAEKEMLQ